MFFVLYLIASYHIVLSETGLREVLAIIYQISKAMGYVTEGLGQRLRPNLLALRPDFKTYNTDKYFIFE